MLSHLRINIWPKKWVQLWLTAHWHRSSCALVARFRSFQLPKMKLKFKSWYFDTLEFFCLHLFSCSLPKEVKSNTRWAIFVKFADKTGTASLPSSDDPAVGDFTEWVSCPSWTRMHQKLKRWRLYSRVNTFPLLSFRWMLSKEKLTNTYFYSELRGCYVGRTSEFVLFSFFRFWLVRRYKSLNFKTKNGLEGVTLNDLPLLCKVRPSHSQPTLIQVVQAAC